MKLFKTHLFLFILLCFVASVMSINYFKPSMLPHHGGKPGCRGRRRPWPNNGNNNNSSTNNGNTGGQDGQTEQL